MSLKNTLVHRNLTNMDRFVYLFEILIFCSITQSIASQTHYQPCTEKEIRRKGCLNDGVCRVIELENREVLCRCKPLWTGPRCLEQNQEYIFRSSTFPLNRTTTWIIIVAAVVVGLLIGAIVMFCVSKWYRRRRRARRPTTDKEDHNGHRKRPSLWPSSPPVRCRSWKKNRLQDRENILDSENYIRVRSTNPSQAARTAQTD